MSNEKVPDFVNSFLGDESDVDDKVPDFVNSFLDEDKKSTSLKSKPIENVFSDVIVPKALSGITMGFSDELAGLGGVITDIVTADQQFPGFLGLSSEELMQQSKAKDFETPPTIKQQSLLDTYRQMRDQVRQQNLAAEEQYPKTSTAAEMGAGLLIPGGVLGKTATKGVNLGKRALMAAGEGALMGAITGAGVSEAEITPDKVYQEDVDKFLDDIETGTIYGSVIGGGVPLAVPAIKAPIKTASGAVKAIKNTITDIPSIEDMLKSYKYGTKGIDVSGVKAYEKFGQEAVDLAENVSKDLSSEGTKLAKKQTEILESSPETLDALKYIKSFSEEGQKIPKVGSRAKADVSEISNVSNDMIYEYGLTKKQKEMFEELNQDIKELNIMRKLNEIDKDQYNYSLEKINSDKDDLMLQAEENLRNLPLKDVNKIKKSLSGMSQIASKTDIPELRTTEAQKLASSKAKDITEEMYNVVPELKSTNELITEFNNAMDLLKLSKVNENVKLNADDLANVKGKLFKIIKDANRETDSSILARDAVKKLDEVLQKTNPELAKKIIPQMLDISEKLDLSKKSVGSGNIIGSVLSLGGKTVTVSNKLGLWTKIATDATPEQLKMLSLKVSKVGGKTAQELSRILHNASEVSSSRRRAIMFSLMQNPEYRNILGVGQEDERSK